MEFTELVRNDEAVSPVIGVILMVAITVILAAVIGTFVLGLGSDLAAENPQASFTFDFDDSTPELTITHDGGDKLDRSNIEVKSDSGSVSPTSDFSTEITAGDSATYTGDGIEASATVRVTWTSPNGGDSATLGKWTGPGT